MKFPEMSKARALGLVCAVGAIAAPLSVTSSASADTTSAPMTVLCTLSPAGQASATPADLSTPASTAALCASSEAAGTATAGSATAPAAVPTVGATPDNQVNGNCGYSYIYGYNDGGGNAKISTGLGVIAPISYGSATVHFSINSENLYVSGNVGPDTWGEVIYHHTGTGPQTASLDADVQLTNGDVCTSGHPTTSYTVS